MSISQSLANAVSGMNASSRMAKITASNLANALTPGYGRRQVNLTSGGGPGIVFVGIERIQDRGIVAERRLSDAQLGQRQTSAEAAARLETLLGAPGDESGVGGRIAALEASLYAAGSTPSSDQRLTTVVRSLNDVAQAFNDDAAGLRAERQIADKSIAAQVDTLNTALKQVEILNVDIGRAMGAGVDPSGLIDQRQRAIDRISGIVPVRELDRSNGQVALFTTSGGALIDGKAAEFGFDQTNVIMPHMSLGGGMLSGITRDGVPLASDGFGKLKGGTIEAAFTLRDTTLPDAEQTLDALAEDMIGRFQNATTDPSLGGADAGLFTDGGNPFTGPAIAGLAGRIAVNAAVDPTKSGDLSRLRDGVSATTAGPVGNSAQIDRWIDALSEARPLSIGGGASGAAELAGRFASGAGAARIAAEDAQAFASARWTSIKEAELAGGVDTDVELQSLLRIEQSYAANARVIQTIQSMMQRLMEI